MPYIFLDDGHPEARDYDSSYLYYDDNDPEQLTRILKILDQRAYEDRPHLARIEKQLAKTLEAKRRRLIEEQRRERVKKRGVKRMASALLDRFARAIF